jgi:uridine kinase
MLLVGIGGGSGSGKTTVALKLIEAIGHDKAVLLAQDAYYKDNSHLTLEKRAEINFDHPDSIDSDLLLEHVDRLAAGYAIYQPIYDLTHHVRQTETRKLDPQPLVVVEGTLILEIEKLYRKFKLKVFVDAEADIRFIRRLRRDLAMRGRTVDSVVDQYLATVRPMHLKFVEPSRSRADIILSEGAQNSVGMNSLIRIVKGHLAI